MNRIYVIIFIWILGSIATTKLAAQSIISHSAYEFIGDNREYFSHYGFPQTILGGRISQDFEFALDSSHSSFTVGASHLHIFGANPFANAPKLNAYYKHSHKNNSLTLGSFPTPTNIFPLAAYTDSLYYFKTNSQGALYEFNHSFSILNIKETGIFDWVLLENYGENELFYAGVSGNISIPYIRTTHSYYYRHHAKDTTENRKSIEDNGFALATIGVYSDSSDFKFSVDIGGITSWQKHRFGGNFKSTGIITFVTTSYKRFALDGTYYYGSGMYLPMGDPLYRSGNYGRLDAKITFIDAPGVKGIFNFATHIIDKEINFQQQLYLKINIDAVIKK